CTHRASARSGYEPSWPPSNFAGAPEHQRSSPSGSAPLVTAQAAALALALAALGVPVAPAPWRRWQDTIGMATTTLRGANMAATSELRPETDSEKLGLVEPFLPERIGDVQSDRPYRRLPRHTDTSAHARCRALLDFRLDAAGLRQLGGSEHDIGRFDLVQSTEIGEDTPAHPELLG